MQEQRHALRRAYSGGLGQRGAVGVDAVGQHHHRRGRRAAQVVQHAAHGRPQARALAGRARIDRSSSAMPAGVVPGDWAARR